MYIYQMFKFPGMFWQNLEHDYEERKGRVKTVSELADKLMDLTQDGKQDEYTPFILAASALLVL